MISPVPTGWRGDAALALNHLGRREEALRARHRAGRAGAQGQGAAHPGRLASGARRAHERCFGQGAVGGGGGGFGVLPGAARARQGVALAGDGVAPRSERVAAREPLARALDIAYSGNAGAIAEIARDELRLAGARPRRQMLSGPESLTPAERRVAELAAAGTTNREIAQHPRQPASRSRPTSLTPTRSSTSVRATSSPRRSGASSREAEGKVRGRDHDANAPGSRSNAAPWEGRLRRS